MLSVLGQSSGANVGQILGDKSKGVIKSLVIHGGSFTAAEYADDAAVQAALISKSMLERTNNEKIYWLPEVQNFEDRSEQNSTGALNLGPTVMLKEGKPGYEIRVDGTSEFAKAMRKWNNKTVGIYEFDSNNELWGYASGTTIRGYSAKIYVNSMRVASGQAPEEGIVTITVSFLSATQYGDQAKSISLSNIDISVIRTQVDAYFSVGAAPTGNTHRFKLQIPLGNAGAVYDVLSKFSSQITTGGANLFEAATGANFGTPLAITSATLQNGLLEVVFNSAAWSALPAATSVRFKGKAPSVFDAAGITDIETVPIIVVKP